MPSKKSALDRATDETSYRIDTIAATEAATAHETEQQEQVSRLSSGDSTWRGYVFKVWDSTLDRRLCAVCSSSTGEVRPLGLDFSSGTPGHTHPRCRCRSAVFAIPWTQASE